MSKGGVHQWFRDGWDCCRLESWEQWELSLRGKEELVQWVESKTMSAGTSMVFSGHRRDWLGQCPIKNRGFFLAGELVLILWGVQQVLATIRRALGWMMSLVWPVTWEREWCYLGPSHSELSCPQVLAKAKRWACPLYGSLEPRNHLIWDREHIIG